jgi:hypothetical protein
MVEVLEVKRGLDGLTAAGARFELQRAYEISGIVRGVLLETRRYEELREQLVHALGKNDGKGHMIVDPKDNERLAAFMAHMNELLLLESDLKLEPILTLAEVFAALQPDDAMPDDAMPDAKKPAKKPRIEPEVFARLRPLLKE